MAYTRIYFVRVNGVLAGKYNTIQYTIGSDEPRRGFVFRGGH